MGRLVWLVAGVALGAVLADLFSRTPQGRILTAAVNDLGRVFVDSYRTGRAELESGN